MRGTGAAGKKRGAQWGTKKGRRYLGKKGKTWGKRRAVTARKNNLLSKLGEKK